KNILEPPFRGICVQGEISNLKLQTSGHLYFSLKDKEAQLSSVLFRGNASQLKRMPKEGDQVIAKGEISLYAPRGQYQMIVRELEYAGVGELLLKLHQLKETLRLRGWFEESRKKPLPHLPKRIGVVTSPTGAVIQDILHVLQRRFGGVHLLLNPVKVQGEGAAQEIAQAIHDFNRYQLADVLIVGRGGGSIEDLWAFNEEIVAQAIFSSHIPVISAVGHETDFTIADWVADMRAPTPSAAAEIAIAEKSNLLKFLKQAELSATQGISQKVSQSKQQLKAIQRHPLLSSPYTLLAQPMQQLDDFRARLELLKPSNQITQLRQRLLPYGERLESAAKWVLREKKERLRALYQHLISLDPRQLLKKGYAILFDAEKKSVILSAKEIAQGQTIQAQLHDGFIQAVVDSVK
ncbi:MAG: exodeoxyribonuclease VII large subunit, partial [Chlamydiia bacterium]|nr:exodeoxyribonuclease VII large subunit [Chlamydiia bacterium]